MSKTRPNRFYLLGPTAVLALAAFLAACGVKGDPKVPPGAEDERPRGQILYPPAHPLPESRPDAEDEDPGR